MNPSTGSINRSEVVSHLKYDTAREMGDYREIRKDSIPTTRPRNLAVCVSSDGYVALVIAAETEVECAWIVGAESTAPVARMARGLDRRGNAHQVITTLVKRFVIPSARPIRFA